MAWVMVGQEQKREQPLARLIVQIVEQALRRFGAGMMLGTISAMHVVFTSSCMALTAPIR
jgi:hypothetical protein